MTPAATSPIPTPAVPARRHFRCGRLVRALCGWLLLAAATALAGLTWVGFPRAVTDRLLGAVNKGGYYCQVAKLTLDLRGGLAARDVQVYRKGVVGPSFLDARDVRVRFRFFSGHGQGRVKGIVVHGGVVRPCFLPVRDGDDARAGTLGLDVFPGGAMAVRVEESDVLGVWVERLTGNLLVGGGGGKLSRIEGVVGQDHQRGEVRGSVSWEGGRRVRGSLAISFDPHTLTALGRTFGLAQMVRTIEWSSFSGSPPNMDLAFDYTGEEAPRLIVTGHGQASGFAYRGAGIAFGSASGSVEWTPEGGRMILNPLVLVLGGRNVSGNVAVDFGMGRAAFEVVSTADIAALARVIGFDETSYPSDWHFGAGTRVYAKGVVGYDDPMQSDMEAAVEGTGIGIGRIVADECSFRFLMKGVTNSLADVRGKIGGGSFTGAASFVPEETGGTGTVTRYQIKGGLIHVDFQKLLGLLDSQAATRAEGKVYGNIDLTGLLGAGRGSTAKGQGHVSVRQGCVFRIPLFGGMTAEVAKAVPGLDMALKQTEMRMPFEIKDGRVRSRDVQIEGEAVSFTAKGDCGFDGNLSFDVQVRPLTEKSLIGQAMRVLTYPISRLLEFRLDGTLQRPRWRPFSLVREERGLDSSRREGKP